ncbi:hypothetical protein M569_16240, partial [Genlisea aurea]
VSRILIAFLSFLPSILAQQPYEALSTTNCSISDNSAGVLGYACNGLRRTCQSYLTFRSISPYNTVASISALLSTNSTQVARLNSISANATLPDGTLIVVPATCSCSGQVYQANSTHVAVSGDSYLVIANNTFQGLSTCQALQAENNFSAASINIGDLITVPLRCACPTGNQKNQGINYLLSYLVIFNQDISTISGSFGVNTSSTSAANQLTGPDPQIYPFTTLLVPLQNPPGPAPALAPRPAPPPPPPGGGPLPISPPASSSGDGGGGGGRGVKSWVYYVVGIVGGVGLLTGATVLFLYLRKRRNNKAAIALQSFGPPEKNPMKKDDDWQESDSFSREFLDSLSGISQSLKVYPFAELSASAGGFGPDSLIKGSVYRAVINGDDAAVKKIHGGDVTKEIDILNKINHFNLIRLSGVSFNQGNWYLIYEYAANGSLHDSIGTLKLTWNQRLQIISDVAAGLNYLHSFTSPPCVHKDLCSDNVLLDRDFRAKISNFRLARTAQGGEGEFALTRHIVGTQGYMPPEYLENGIISPQLDVYAFGVLMLEILTGKQVPELFEMGGVHQLAAMPLSPDAAEEKLKDAMDPRLEGDYPPEFALVLFRIIEGCLRKDPSDRPDMETVFQTIERISTAS